MMMFNKKRKPAGSGSGSERSSSDQKRQRKSGLVQRVKEHYEAEPVQFGVIVMLCGVVVMICGYALLNGGSMASMHTTLPLH